MLPDIERTIVALASGAQAAPRAIVRLAGPGTRDVLLQVCGWNSGKTATFDSADFLSGTRPQVHHVQCPIPLIGRAIPITILYWPDHRSYTGQPSAELHMIGSLPLVEAVIARCTECGAQPAERGEFTLRAFLAGKLDLAQAEAVLGVIEADSHTALKSALAQLGGNLAPEVRPLRERIVDVVAELEAGLDFVDEDIQFISTDELVAQLESVQSALQRFMLRLNTRSTSQHLPRVILAGLPNSGKSSLFNALANEQLAIVADVAGTTRDYLERQLTFADSMRSVDAVLVDTAGWESLIGDDPRALAQQQLVACLRQADLGLLCIDVSQACHESEVSDSEVIEVEVIEAFERLVSHTQSQRAMHWIFVATKLDARVNADESIAAINWSAMAEAISRCCQAAEWPVTVRCQPIVTSSLTGAGLEVLKSTIASELLNRESLSDASREASGPLAIVHHTAVRCRAALTAALVGIDAALDYARSGSGEELVAAELRLVLDDLASIIGEVHSDDILGEIFARFCIGK